jgi:AcrR family transcriptional regulator
VTIQDNVLPRDAQKVRRRLQEAALTLFQTRGYEQTTAADIAAEAGVTQRTFFRHFPDKREVLFGGEAEFIDGLTKGVLSAAPGLGPWDTLLHACRSVEALFVENRSFSAPRRLIIAANPALQERAQTKTQDVMTALASALRQRGVADRSANLVAHMGMAAMGHAVAVWFENGSTDLSIYIEKAFREVHELSAHDPALSH